MQKTSRKHQVKKALGEHKFALLFVALVLGLITAATIIQRLTPDTQLITGEPWRTTEPGTKVENLEDLAAGASQVSELRNSTIFEYNSRYPSFPNKVVLDTRSQTVVTTIEQVKPNPEDTLSDFTSLYGSPDVTAAYPKKSRTAQVSVFLQEGIIVVSHVTSGAVEEVWRTTPMTEEIFWKRFYDDFSPNPRYGDAFEVVDEELF